MEAKLFITQETMFGEIASYSGRDDGLKNLAEDRQKGDLSLILGPHPLAIFYE